MHRNQNFRSDYDNILSHIESMELDAEPELCRFEVLVLALEDRRFFNHPGYDLLSILRVFLVNLLGRKGGGASTIEQQLVRTITNQREKKVSRKIREIRLARKLKGDFSKKEILRAYLSIAYFGENSRGSNAASKSLFGLPIDELTIEQSAKIASCLLFPIPARKSDRWSKLSKRRSRYAIDLCRRLSKGIDIFGFRFGVRLPRPFLVSRELACAMSSFNWD